MHPDRFCRANTALETTKNSDKILPDFTSYKKVSGRKYDLFVVEAKTTGLADLWSVQAWYYDERSSHRLLWCFWRFFKFFLKALKATKSFGLLVKGKYTLHKFLSSSY